MQEIRHKAKIVQVNAHSVEAEIEVKSACAQCALLKACQMHEVSQCKIIIPLEDGKIYQKGEVVDVSISLDEGMLAAFYAYVLPLILVLLTLFVSLVVGLSEIISGICSIIVLIPYYFGVFLKKNFFARMLNFKIVKIENSSH